ncbi:MAG: hypothetical protein ACRDV9_00295 [Acidimicrobiia bacterium]
MGAPDFDDPPSPVEQWHTDELPATPVRDRTIAASQWVEAPAELLALGADIDQPTAGYRRRIGRYLIFRAGPPSRGDARYMALAMDRPEERYTYRLFSDGSGEGVGPDGRSHVRLRTWKEALRDAG